MSTDASAASFIGGGSSRLHAVSYAAFVAQLSGYVFFSSVLQWRFYHSRGRNPSAWKVQADVAAHLPDGRGQKVSQRSCDQASFS